MSRSIDERIVQMTFDNKQFESGAQESMSTLEKLKEKLSHLGTEDSLDSLGSSVSTVGEKFSWLEEIGIGALRRIGEAAVDAAKDVLDFAVFDNISAGWEKYAKETTAIQTLMSSTRQYVGDGENAMWATVEDQQAAMEEYANKLGWFSDETSYSYDQMIDTASQFVANGIDIEKAITSMTGIASWAGLSGVSVEKASTAFDALAKSIGRGYVQLGDWRRLEQISFSTPEFRQAILDSAVAAGEITKIGDNLYEAYYETDKETKTLQFTRESIASTLTRAKWLTTDVLNDALEDTGKATEELYKIMSMTGYGTEDSYYDMTSDLLADVELYKKGTLDVKNISEETGVSIEKLQESFSKLASEEYDTGLVAFKASQEAKTFKEAWDSVADAASSVWKDIFKSIFGNYTEARKLWTAVANELWDFFVGPLDSLRTAMREWNKKGGRDLLLEGVSNAWENFGNILGAVSEGFHEVFGELSSDKLVAITKGFKELTERLMANEKVLNAIKMVSKIFFSIIKAGTTIIGTVVKGIVNLTNAVIDYISNSEIANRLFEALGAAIQKVGDILKTVGSRFVEFKNAFRETAAYEKFIQIWENVKTVLGNVFGPIIDLAIEKLNAFSNTEFTLDVAAIAESANDKIMWLIEKLKAAIDRIKEFGEAIGITNFGGRLLEEFNKMKEGGISLESFTTMIGNLKEDIVQVLKSIWESLTSGEYGPLKWYSQAKEATENLGKGLKEGWEGIDFSSLLDLAKAGSIAFVITTIGWFVIQIANLVKKVTAIPKGFTKVLGEISDTLRSYQRNLDAGTILKLAIAMGVLTGAIYALGKLDRAEVEQGVLAVGAVTACIVALILAADKFLHGSANPVEQTQVVIAKAVKKFATLGGYGAALAGLGIAVGLIVHAMKTLSGMNWQQVLYSSTMLGIIAAALVYAMRQLQAIGFGMSAKVAVNLIALAFAIDLLVPAIAILGLLGNTGVRGVIEIVAIIVAISKVAQAANNESIQRLAVSMIVIAAAMLILGPALNILNENSINNLLMFAFVLGTVLAVAKLAGPGLIIISEAAIVLAGSALILGVALLAGAAAFTVFAFGVGLLGESLPKLANGIVEAAQIIADSGTVIAEAILKILNNIEIAIVAGTPKIMMIAAASVIAVIGGVGLAIVQGAALIVAYLVVAVQMIANSFRALAIPLSNAIVDLVDSLVGVFFLALISALEGLFGRIPVVGDIIKGIKADVIEDFELMGEEAGDALVSGVESGITDGTPEVEAAVEEVGAKSGGILDGFGELFNGKGLNFMDSLSGGILEGGLGVTDATGNVASDSLLGLGDLSSLFGETGGNWMDSLGGGILGNMDAVVGGSSEVGESGLASLFNLNSAYGETGELNVNNYMSSILGAEGDNAEVNKLFGELGLQELIDQAPDYEETGDENTTEYLEAVIDNTDENVDANEEFGKAGLEELQDFADDYEETGEEHTEEYAQGITEKTDVAVNAAENLGNEAADEIWSTRDRFETAGENAGEGFASGIRSKISSAVSAAAEMASNAWNSVKSTLGIASPSKEMMKLGEYSDEGFAVGMVRSLDVVTNASELAANSALDSVRNALSNVNNILDEELDSAPIIRPVIDLSNIEHGSDLISGLLGGYSTQISQSGYGLQTSDARMLDMLGSIMGTIGTPQSSGDIIFNITGGPNATAEDIANEVENIITDKILRRKAAWG